MTAPADTVLEVRDLTVDFPSADGTVHAVRGVSFDVRRGEVLGIVGESGSGKSVTSTALIGLHDRSATVTGSIELAGEQVVGASDAAMSRLRGARVGMVFQDPLASLDPVQRVGDQVAEAILTHRRMSRAQARAEAVDLLDAVGIPHASARARSFPHEFSGGMRQRVVIAIAMANEPDLIVADEPTTALDVTVQAQVLDALDRARERANAALLLVTHDLGVVAGRADRVLVMYGGRLVESGGVDDIFYRSRMPYTRGLLAALPRFDLRGQRLAALPGAPPRPTELTGGSCPFAPRCDHAAEPCRGEEPALTEVADGHTAACHFAGDEDVLPPAEPLTAELAAGEEREERAAGTPLLDVVDLAKRYKVRLDGTTALVHAVSDVSFSIAPGEVLGLVGESGCGKSTVSRCVTRLDDATAGSVRLGDHELTALSGRTLREQRRRIQMVFQDPFSSLDPRMNVRDLIAEPLRLSGYPRARRADRTAELLTAVGLDESAADRYPHEFSGGQRQRLGIARALATEPDVLVLDEPVSALDVSVQAGIVNLLSDLVRERDLGYLFIAHDLSVVAHVSDRIAVMYLGRIVELAPSTALFAAPAHPYTRALISAVPVPDPRRERSRAKIVLEGDVPSPVEPPTGCPFRSRCPVYRDVLTESQQDACGSERPELAETRTGHLAACHYPQMSSLSTVEESRA